MEAHLYVVRHAALLVSVEALVDTDGEECASWGAEEGCLIVARAAA